MSKRIKHDKTKVIHYYRKSNESNELFLKKLKLKIDNDKNINIDINNLKLEKEFCFNIEIIDDGDDNNNDSLNKLHWLLSETFEKNLTSTKSFLDIENNKKNEKIFLIEVGPRLSFETAWSTNAKTIFKSCSLHNIKKIERSRIYKFDYNKKLNKNEISFLTSQVYDRMTECVYENKLTSFENINNNEMKQTRYIDVLKEGKKALKDISDEMGLAFDDWDLDFYTKLYKDKMKRNPTDVELFDLAQSNSEHSRHWFFSGIMEIDNEIKKDSLFKLVKDTNPEKSGNSIIAFHDNSSAIKGFDINRCVPNHNNKDGTTNFLLKKQLLHGILTCETHNFPSAVAPFPGAETGTGGRIRDVQATGRGAHVVAGTSSYCVGNLNIPDYDLPWEDKSFEYPSNLAKPLEIEIEASNGASDYGNKFGEPVIGGYTRSFGMKIPELNERREWIKPIMMSAGIGLLDGKHTVKEKPAEGMIVVKIGGPAYRIGMGGGAASSRVSDVKTAELDFNAVQRGDAEMENKMNRVIRACINLEDKNPILSIHDQGKTKKKIIIII